MQSLLIYFQICAIYFVFIMRNVDIKFISKHKLTVLSHIITMSYLSFNILNWVRN